jgi:hypothetical protein
LQKTLWLLQLIDRGPGLLRLELLQFSPEPGHILPDQLNEGSERLKLQLLDTVAPRNHPHLITSSARVIFNLL